MNRVPIALSHGQSRIVVERKAVTGKGRVVLGPVIANFAAQNQMLVGVDQIHSTPL